MVENQAEARVRQSASELPRSLSLCFNLTTWDIATELRFNVIKIYHAHTQLPLKIQIAVTAPENLWVKKLEKELRLSSSFYTPNNFPEGTGTWEKDLSSTPDISVIFTLFSSITFSWNSMKIHNNSKISVISFPLGKYFIHWIFLLPDVRLEKHDTSHIEHHDYMLWTLSGF